MRLGNVMFRIVSGEKRWPSVLELLVMLVGLTQVSRSFFFKAGSDELSICYGLPCQNRTPFRAEHF